MIRISKVFVLSIFLCSYGFSFDMGDFSLDDGNYNYYIGGNVDYLMNVGGASVYVPSVVGSQYYEMASPGQGMAGSMYLGIEFKKGYSFEIGALQMGSVTDYVAPLGNYAFSNRVNMTVPYFGFGYRIPMYVPSSLDNSYFQWLKKVSFKPFVGLGVGIANNIFYPNYRMEDYTRTTGNQIDAYVSPYFKIDIQYQITEHLYLGGNVGYLLKTNYAPMEVTDPRGTINVSGMNDYNSLMLGTSLQYNF